MYTRNLRNDISAPVMRHMKRFSVTTIFRKTGCSKRRSLDLPWGDQAGATGCATLIASRGTNTCASGPMLSA
jgi:hypothetical protein